MPVASSIALKPDDIPLSPEWRGHVGMWCLIAAESAMFSIFVIAYLYYAGKSLSGPTPNGVLPTIELTAGRNVPSPGSAVP